VILKAKFEEKQLELRIVKNITFPSLICRSASIAYHESIIRHSVSPSLTTANFVHLAIGARAEFAHRCAVI